MAEQNKFGQKPEGLRCEEWEALLADALDGLLPTADAAAFKAHSETCAGCADLLAHAEQGREWLNYLHTEPDVPPGLVEKILNRTVAAGSMPLPVVAGAQGVGAVAMAVPLRRSFHEARLMMTVAMAFFSIALTLNGVLNLAGVKLTSLRLADLRPSAIGSTLSREFYGARGQVVRYYENLRFVYQLESRMRELRRDVETAPPQQQNKQPEKPKNGQSKAEEDGSVLRARGTAIKTHSSVLRAQSIDHEESRTEIETLAVTQFSISLGHYRAGQQRNAEDDGRSLA